MTLTTEQISETFHKLYEVSKNDFDRIPSQIVFDRLAKELDVKTIFPAEVNNLITQLGVVKKSVTFSNGNNHFINELNGGRFRTITPNLKNEYITKYNNQPKFTIKTIVGIREKEPPTTQDPTLFDKKKHELIHALTTTTQLSELIDVAKDFIELNSQPPQTLLDEYKAKKMITVNKIPTTIRFNT